MMNKDITLEDLGWEEIEPFAIFRKTYRKVDEILDYEELKEEVKNGGKVRYKYINFTDFKFLGKTIEIEIQEVEAKVENEELYSKKLGKICKIANAQMNLSMKELQAIYNKCRDLGWLDE